MKLSPKRRRLQLPVWFIFLLTMAGVSLLVAGCPGGFNVAIKAPNLPSITISPPAESEATTPPEPTEADQPPPEPTEADQPPPEPTEADQPPPEPTKADQPPPPPNGKTETVKIIADPQAPGGYKFEPLELKISKGTKVIWVNGDKPEDNVVHTATQVVSDGGVTDFDLTISGSSPMDSQAFTFNKIGTFEYECQAHKAMTHGKIIVS